MVRTLKSAIKGIDLFGHPITLKFNQHGDIHRTICGGLVSIIFLILTFIVIVVKLGEVSMVQ
jgi:hypothetical protein